MKQFLKKHRIAIFLALFVGCVTGLPTVLAPLAIGSAYHGVPFLPLNDEYYYAARIQEIVDGHWLAASPFLYEYKNLPVLEYPVNEWMYAIPALFFGVMPTIIAGKFVLPAILFIVSYFFFLGIFRREDDGARWSAVAGSLVIVLGAEFVSYSYLGNILRGGYPVESLWTRTVNPIMGGIQLMAFLLVISKVWDRSWRYGHLIAGVLLAGMVGYFFSFGLALSILGVLFMCALVRKEYDVARKLLYVGVISLVLDSFWWQSILFSLGGEEGKARALLNGMFFTHEPVLNKAVLVATCIVAAFFSYAYFYLRRREYVREYMFAFSLLLGCWLAYNEQVITGRQVWYPHFAQYSVPMCVAAVMISGYFAFRGVRYVWPTTVGFLCVICVAHGLYSVTSYMVPVDLAYFTRIQSLSVPTRWFNEHAPNDCVVLVNGNNRYSYDEERLIPTLSHCNTYTVDYPIHGNTPVRVEHNYLLRLRMLGVSTNNVHEYLLGRENDMRGQFMTDWHQAFGHGMEPWIVDQINLLSKEYRTFSIPSLETQVKKYRVDYLLSEGPLQQKLLLQFSDLELATSTGGYYIYHFNSK